MFDLDNFRENSYITVHPNDGCDCFTCKKFGFHSATAVHVPTGIVSDNTQIIREFPCMNLHSPCECFYKIECPTNLALTGLRIKLEAYYKRKEAERRWREEDKLEAYEDYLKTFNEDIYVTSSGNENRSILSIDHRPTGLTSKVTQIGLGAHEKTFNIAVSLLKEKLKAYCYTEEQKQKNPQSSRLYKEALKLREQMEDLSVKDMKGDVY